MTITPLQTSTDFQTWNGPALAILECDVSDKPRDIAESFCTTNAGELTSDCAHDCITKSQRLITSCCARDWRYANAVKVDECLLEERSWSFGSGPVL